MNTFDQSINAIEISVISHEVDTWHATSSSLEIESLLVIINNKSKWYFWIPNFKSFKYINIKYKIIIYLPKNWTSFHIDYSLKTMMPHGILMSVATTEYFLWPSSNSSSYIVRKIIVIF
jgi:hypothetical protein